MKADLALGGILAILVTPFDEDLNVDEESYRAQIDFCIAAGATGVISTALFGEFYTLSDEERRRIARVTVDQTAGRVPVIATTSGTSIPHAVELTQAAWAAGVDAVMAMPPYVAHLPRNDVQAYFAALAAVSRGPIIIQNAAQPVGAPVPPEDLAAMLAEIERVEYIKEEVPPNPHSVTATAKATEGLAKGIFGGWGGLYMPTEYRRGATGWMVAPEFLEVQVCILDLLSAGREEEARGIHGRLLPALVSESLLGIPWAKRALQRRGVIRSTVTRVPSPGLDDDDEHELDWVMSQLADLLVTPGRWPATLPDRGLGS